MLFCTLLLSITALAILFFYMLDIFGDTPNELDRTAYEKLSYFKEGKFLSNEPITYHFDKVEGGTLSVLKFLKKSPYAPRFSLPKVDLKRDDFPKTPDSFSLYWLGHSSAIMDLNGKRFIFDPVLDNGGPLPFIVRRYDKSPLKRDELPLINYVVLTHNHYDHMEKKTLQALKNSHFIVPLGVGAALRGWGISEHNITEIGWDETYEGDGFTVTGLTGKHYSGRSFLDRNKTLWNSYALNSQGRNIYWGGDSGYGSHFKEIGEKYGPFDFAALEIDAWNPGWPDIHLFPHQVIQAAQDLKTTYVLPIHWGVFDLALHPWHESIDKVLQEAQSTPIKIMTPKMGERIIPTRSSTKKWWLESEEK